MSALGDFIRLLISEHDVRLRAHIDRRLDELEQKITQVLARLPPPSHATRLVLELPTRTRNGVIMANYELKNDSIDTITVKATNAAGVFEPIPAGDTFTVAVSDPASLNAVMGTDAAGNVALVVNALVQHASNVTVTVSDSAGLKAVEQVFDIVDDVTPTNLVLDVADATHAPQAVPAV